MKKYLEYINENNKSLEKEWFNAIERGNVEKVKELINKGVDINCIGGFEDFSGLNAAVYYGRKDVANLLLQQPGIDVNLGDNNERSCLFNAAMNGLDGFVEAFLKHPNIDVNFQEPESGWSPLMIAFYNNHKNIGKNILKYPSIDVYIKNEDDENFIDLIIKCNRSLEDLIDYNLQKEIIKNNEKNILLFDKYGLVHPKIKEEYSDLFSANNWGLI